MTRPTGYMYDARTMAGSYRFIRRRPGPGVNRKPLIRPRALPGAREIVHEHSRLLAELLAGYHVSLSREVGPDPTSPRSYGGKPCQWLPLLAT